MTTTLVKALARAASPAVRAHGLHFLDRHERSSARSWRDVHERARSVAGGIRALDVRVGDPVAVVFPTGPAFFDAFFGATLAGAVPVPLYPPTRLGRLDEYRARTAAMLRAVRARVVLTDTATRAALCALVQDAALDVSCVDVSTVRGPAVEHEARPAELALVQFSSGTTFDPKPVALSHAAILANVRAIREVLLQAGSDVIEHGVSWLPLCHDMGLIGCVMLALDHPASLTLIPPEVFVARPAVWLRALARSRALVSAAPNFAYALCTERIRDDELDDVDLSAWRFALNGSEPVSARTLRNFGERFARWGFRAEALTPVYGLAEAAVGVTFSDWRRPFNTTRFERAALADGRVVPAADGLELVSLGHPLPGVEIDVPEGTVGPILVRGPSVMTGYLHQPAATASVLVDGWLNTGDLGFRHHGELFVCGRAKDVIVLRGRKYAPQDVEQALDSVEGVQDGGTVAVGHRGDNDDEERLVTFVEARVATSDLAERCARAVLLATALDTSRVVVLLPGQIPRTSSGKVRRGETVRRWLAGQLSEAVSPTAGAQPADRAASPASS